MLDAAPALLICALACLLPVSAAAQAQPETVDEAEAKVLEFGAELLARHGMAPRAPAKGAAPRAAALDTLELARGRAEALAALIQRNPGRALAAALPQETLDELRARSPQIAPYLEERGSWEGAAALYIADDVEKQQAIEFHILDTPDGSIEAYGIPRGGLDPQRRPRCPSPASPCGGASPCKRPA